MDTNLKCTQCGTNLTSFHCANCGRTLSINEQIQVINCLLMIDRYNKEAAN